MAGAITGGKDIGLCQPIYQKYCRSIGW